MMNSQARQARQIGFGTYLALTAALYTLWACSAPAPDDERAAPRSSANSQPGSAEPAPVSPLSAGHGAGSNGGASFQVSPADLVGALSGQVGSVCGVALESCAATDGCDDIVACAAEHACTGATCYCADARCEMPGPCQSVIDGAPGAVRAAAPSVSRGPAADAAAAVGACIERLLAAPGGASEE